MSWTAGPCSSRHARRAGCRSAPRFIPLAVLASLLFPATDRIPAAAPEPTAKAFAAALDREIAALQTELDALGGEERSEAGEIERLSTKEALSRRRFDRAAWERDDVVREVAAGETRSRDLARTLETSRARARRALRESYIQSSIPAYVSLLAVAGPSDLLRASQSLEVLARRQNEAVVSYELAAKEAADSALRLKERKLSLDAAIAEASLEASRLKEDREARLLLLDRLRKDRRLQQEALDEMTRAMAALNDAIGSLSPDSPPPKVSISFSRLEGALPWPAKGAIQVPYGSVRNPRFGTMTPHPGIDFSVEPGTPVRSVGAGRVVFNRRYGGYGRTVVIDHGERYLSVYAHLAAASVSESDDVAPGQEIGFAGEADAHGKSSFYFEIRHQGKALDPAAWLRRQDVRVRSGGTP
jgi:murein hydrolase activator